MPFATHCGAKIFYDTIGPRTDRPLVFVEGLGAQMVGWREPFCQRFVDIGFWVIRLDNRDVGLSERFGDAGDIDGGYDLEDMARDTFGVLDALGLESAHIAGQSMGGMIAQAMAIMDPKRVRSMSLFYTAPASATYGADGIATMMAQHRPSKPASSRDAAIEAMVEGQRLCASTAYPFDEDWTRTLAGLRLDRCEYPEGPLRQYAAIQRAADRLPALRTLDTVTAIIHGRADRLIKLEAALDLALALKNAELHLFPGMGHEIARPLWDEFVRIIDRTAARAPATHLS